MQVYHTQSRLQRVNRANPCAICGRFDWCSFCAAFIICMRVSVGAIRETANGGWVHLRSGSHPIPLVTPAEQPPQRHDLHILAEQFRTAVNPIRLARFARTMGLTVANLQRLHIGYDHDHKAYSFPMSNVSGDVLGIRLRAESGRKFAVTGGREGLFIPSDLDGDELLICEGPTDTTAMLDCGFSAVGRPCAIGGVKLLMELVKARGTTSIVIVSDPDEVGQRGAIALADVLHVPRLKIIRPPDGVKDARQWVNGGATAADVQQAIDAADIFKRPVPTIRVIVKGGRR